MCYSNDFEASALWSVKRVTTHAEHQCHDCNKTIAVRCEADRIGSLYDGRWETLYVCFACIFRRAWVYGHERGFEGCDHTGSWIGEVGGGFIGDEYRRILRERRSAIEDAEPTA